MWNVMDWTGFMLFVLLYIEFSNLRASLLDTSCNGGAYMCTQMGFHDDWQQFKLTSNIKFYLSVRALYTATLALMNNIYRLALLTRVKIACTQVSLLNVAVA